MRILLQLIKPLDTEINTKKLKYLQTILDQNHIDIETLMRKLTPSCDDMFLMCKWKGREQICNQVFELVKTSEGFCCSFNLHKERDARSLR